VADGPEPAGADVVLHRTQRVAGRDPYVVESESRQTRFTRRIEVETTGVGRLFVPLLKIEGATQPWRSSTELEAEAPRSGPEAAS
jgi:hypothetical protein